MLDEDILIASNGVEFRSKAQEYFVNMTNNARTLHKSCNPKCYPSLFTTKFIAFGSEEEVKAYEVAHKDATPFRRCGNCFPSDGEN